MEATILKPGKAAGAPVTDMLNFLRGGVGGHIFISRNKHDHDATGLEKFENVSSPERYIYTTNAIESVHRQFRKPTKTKGAFPNENSLLNTWG